MTSYLWTMLVLFTLSLISALRTKVGDQDKPATAQGLVIGAILRTAFIAWTLVLLTGCGGGGDDTDQPLPTVPCVERPEVCR